MSTGKIMTLSVQSLNKLYFQFIEQHIVPNLIKNIPEITHLLKQRTAYEAHRYLEDLIANQNPQDHYSSHTNSSVNASINSFNPTAPTSNLYQYALPTEQTKSPYHDNPQPFGKGTDKQVQDKKNFSSKIALRKTLTGLGYEDRAYDYKHSHDDNLMSIPSLNDTNAEPMITVPTLTPSLSSDFRFERVESRDKASKRSIEQAVQKSRIMREAVRKISKIFNDNHSKIEKYSTKAEPQTKLFNLNVSTKLQKREDGMKVKDYQFHTRTDSYTRIY